MLWFYVIHVRLIKCNIFMCEVLSTNMFIRRYKYELGITYYTVKINKINTTRGIIIQDAYSIKLLSYIYN